MSIWSDLKGTTLQLLRIGIGGVTLKNDSGNLAVRNSADGADAALTASKVNVSGDALDINSDAAGSAADWKYTLQRPASGMTAAVTLTLPIDDGTPGQVVQTDGSGILSWVSAAATSDLDHLNETTLNFDSASPLTLYTHPTGAEMDYVEVIIDTPFNGTAPTLSIGIVGTVSKYMGSTQVNLKGTAKDKYVAYPGEIAPVAPETIIATYVADSSSAGSARIICHYATPA